MRASDQLRKIPLRPLTLTAYFPSIALEPLNVFLCDSRAEVAVYGLEPLEAEERLSGTIPRPGRYVEYATTASRKKSERLINELAIVKLSAPVGTKSFDPGRIHKIRDLHSIDFIPLLIEFTWITSFIGVKRSGVTSGLDESVQIDIRIAEHLLQFMTRGDRPLEARLLIRLGKDIAQGKALVRKLMISQRPATSESSTITSHQQPPAGLCSFGRNVKSASIPRQERSLDESGFVVRVWRLQPDL